jgi:molecular chaperone GrpE
MTDHDPAASAADSPPGGPATEETVPAEDWAARLAAAEARAEQARESQLRTAAEMENLRRRAAREVDAARQFGAERLAGDLLPVLDGLEMGLKSGSEADAATLREGQQATLRLLLKALEGAGITELDPIGQPFDPRLHEAILAQPTTHQAPDTVLMVVQKGYVLNGRVLRAARVIVARAPDA